MSFVILPHVRAVVGEFPNYQYLEDVDIMIDTFTGKIEAAKPNMVLPSGDVRVLHDYQNMLVLPGFIDPHVHFRYPGKPEAENWNSGSKAALFAGITTVLEMPNTSPPTVDENGLRIKLEHIEKNSRINYGIFGGLTENNLEFLLSTPEIKAVKVYLASTTGDMLIEKADFSGIRSSKVFTFHAEDESIIQKNREKNGTLSMPIQHSQIRSEEAAINAVRYVIRMAKTASFPIHVAHVSTDSEAKLLNAASLSFECAPHHIFRDTDSYETGGYLWKCNPPIRSPQTAARMRELLYAEKISMIATDHAPHVRSAKEFSETEPASGIPSLEVGTHFILSEMVNGKLSPGQTAKILSGKAAKIFCIEKRGSIAPGFFADLAVVDTSRKWTFREEDIQSACGWSPFTGTEFTAKVTATFVNGREYVSGNYSDNIIRTVYRV